MHPARSRSRRAQSALLRHVKLGAGAALAHLVHVYDVARVLRMRVLAHWTHSDRAQHAVGGADRGNAQHDRAQPADLVLRRHRAAVPWVRRAAVPVVDERETLPLRVLEVEGEAAVALIDLAGAHAQLAEALLPVRERVGA